MKLNLPPLPRPLVIVLIILLVLVVVGCGLAIARSGEQGQNDNEKKSELQTGDFAKIFKRFGPPSQPVDIQTTTVSPSGCLQPSGNLQFTGTCTVIVPATGDLRRRLLLRPAAGFMAMQVSGSSNGESFSSEPQTIGAGSDDGSVVLARNDFATVTLTCTFGCTVLVNPQ